MKNFLIALLLLSAGIFDIQACDLCGCYTPQLEAMPQAPTETPFGQPTMQAWQDRVFVAIGEQFTYFNTVQIDGREVPNETDQYLASSITQLVAGYAFNSRFALQLNIPFIYRSFERPEGFAIDRGTESGSGRRFPPPAFGLVSLQSGRAARDAFRARRQIACCHRLPAGFHSFSGIAYRIEISNR